jgi:hypothetical protein
MSKRKPIVQTSAVNAYYVGDDSDGAYYQVAKGRKGWYVTVWVDGAWTGDIEPIRDHGRPNRKRWIGVEAKRRNGVLRTVFRMRKRTNELSHCRADDSTDVSRARYAERQDRSARAIRKRLERGTGG